MKDLEFPALYCAADDLSIHAQKHFYHALRFHLILLVFAAAISVFYNKQVWLAVVQSLVLLATLAASVYLAVTRPERIWYNARAVAESVKTLTWRYVMRAEPFNIADSSARRKFLKTLSDILTQNKELAGKLNSHIEGDQVTDEMERLRSMSFEQRRLTYLNDRVENQKSWYVGKSRANRRAGKRFFIALIVCNAIATILSILRITFPNAEYWPTDILLALSGSLLAWIQSKRFGELASSYSLAATEIGIIGHQLMSIRTEDAFSGYVGDSENAFSREHTQWVARKDV